MGLENDLIFNVFTEIRDERLSSLYKGFIESLPESLAHKPASSSGKYHNALENGENGLMIHSRLVVRFVDRFCEANGKKDRDELKFAAACHDVGKYGKDGTSEHTLSEHPLIGALMLEEFCKKKRMSSETKERIERILAMIRCHSGRWNRTKAGVEMPTPKTMDEHLLHYADMMASSSFLSATFDDHGLLDGENPF